MLVLNLLAHVFKAWFAPREAKNQHGQLENNTYARARFSDYAVRFACAFPEEHHSQLKLVL